MEEALPTSADVLAAALCRVGGATLFRPIRNEIQTGQIEPSFREVAGNTNKSSADSSGTIED
jgi:hypothetical protein